MTTSSGHSASGHSTRWALAAGSIGLVAGIGLGVTGLASASSPTATSPAPSYAAEGDRENRKQRSHDARRKGHGKGVLVTAVTSDSLTVRTPSAEKTVGLNESTAFYEGKNKVAASAITEGDIVHIRVNDPKAARPMATVVQVLPAHIAGWIRTVQAGTITLVDMAGFTRIVTTGSNTEFTKNGAKSAGSDLAAGDFVRALGAVGPDGTTLSASRVASGPPHRGDGQKPPAKKPAA